MIEMIANYELANKRLLERAEKAEGERADLLAALEEVLASDYYGHQEECPCLICTNARKAINKAKGLDT